MPLQTGTGLGPYEIVAPLAREEWECHFLQCAFIHLAPREKQRKADMQSPLFEFNLFR